MRKQSADQLRSYCAADQRLYFHYTDSTIPLSPKIRNLKPLAVICGWPAQFVSDLGGFSLDAAHLSRKISDPGATI